MWGCWVQLMHCLVRVAGHHSLPPNDPNCVQVDKTQTQLDCFSHQIAWLVPPNWFLLNLSCRAHLCSLVSPERHSFASSFFPSSSVPQIHLLSSDPWLSCGGTTVGPLFAFWASLFCSLTQAKTRLSNALPVFPGTGQWCGHTVLLLHTLLKVSRVLPLVTYQ